MSVHELGQYFVINPNFPEADTDETRVELEIQDLGKTTIVLIRANDLLKPPSVKVQFGIKLTDSITENEIDKLAKGLNIEAIMENNSWRKFEAEPMGYDEATNTLLLLLMRNGSITLIERTNEAFEEVKFKFSRD